MPWSPWSTPGAWRVVADLWLRPDNSTLVTKSRWNAFTSERASILTAKEKQDHIGYGPDLFQRTLRVRTW